jgi:hypothetical protein
MATRWQWRLGLTTVVLALSLSAAWAVPPDFNADRRVNLKCPSTVNRDFEGQFEPDGFKHTIRRLYHDLDDNLRGSADTPGSADQTRSYTFSDDPNQGRFFVCHVKADFPAEALISLQPHQALTFQEVFYLVGIDWQTNRIRLRRQRDRLDVTLSVADFETAFIWYNALLDKQRAFMPIYGFFSLPGDADDFPTIWNSWQGHRTDTATPPESLVDYDFYKVLDYREGYYLLGKDFNELDYRNNIEDYGIIGWVEKKYITLWRSRLYYHPLREVPFFDDRESTTPAAETDEINRFYVHHAYLQEPLFNDIVEKIDRQSLHQFYDHFGFPRLAYPETSGGEQWAEVFIPGAFTPKLMRLLSRSLKANLNVFFLLDVSESMRPFADYIRSFNRAVAAMDAKGFGLRVNRTYTYKDTRQSDRDPDAEVPVTRVRELGDLGFAFHSGDWNYVEPLARAMSRTFSEIDDLQQQAVILPLQQKLLFVMTDAGPNDLTDERFKQLLHRARSLNVRVYFVHPSHSGVRTPSSRLDDTPQSAFEDLEAFIARCESANDASTGIVFRRFSFNAESLASAADREADFQAQQEKLLENIDAYLSHVFGTNAGKEMPKDVILYFSDENLLSQMRNWSTRRIQVLNHVAKVIRGLEQDNHWEARIAVPAKPVETYLRAARTQDDVSLLDLKKLVIINSLVSVDDISQCRRLYDHLKPLIEKKTSRSADDVFYHALTGETPGGQSVQWNRELGDHEGPLRTYLAQRSFHLNAFNQAVQRQFMYLRINELYGE